MTITTTPEFDPTRTLNFTSSVKERNSAHLEKIQTDRIIDGLF
jgi:hypothetical protein